MHDHQVPASPCHLPGDTGGSALCGSGCHLGRRQPWPPFLVSGLLAGGKGSGVHPFSRSSPHRVYLGLRFARR
jgi:hypothetical protein